MSVFAIFLNEPDETAWETLKEKWPNGRSFILTGNLAFVAPEGIVVTSEISEALGIGGETERRGIVFELGSYNGYNRGSLWEWVKKVREE